VSTGFKSWNEGIFKACGLACYSFTIVKQGNQNLTAILGIKGKTVHFVYLLSFIVSFWLESFSFLIPMPLYSKDLLLGLA